MRQVLFQIPGLGWSIYGYGVMLCIAVYLGTWLSARKAARAGMNPDDIWDLSFWFFVCGILGARLFYVLQYRDRFDDPWEFFAVWQGGLVVYGSGIGVLVAFLVFTWRRKLPRLPLADVLAPYIVLGIGIGRIGCLLNGCCYGDYCAAPWSLSFPPGSAPQQHFVAQGARSRLGFQVDPATRRVRWLEPDSTAARAGLRAGDEVVQINGAPIRTQAELRIGLMTAGVRPEDWNQVEERPELTLGAREAYALVVRRPSGAVGSEMETIPLTLRPADSPPIHPTQVYASLSNLLLFLALAAYYPYRRWDGEVVGLMALGESIHRFLVEYLRADESAQWDHLTISQNLAVAIFAAGAGVWIYSRAVSARRATRAREGT